MPRPIWNGTISFGLVTIPIKLFHAVTKRSVSFNQLDDRTMSRIRLKKVSAETGEEVPEDHIVKGYELGKGRYVVVDPDELEPFLPSASRAIELEEFVEAVEVDPVFFDTPYYVAPDKVPKPYVLLARALSDEDKVGIGRFVMRNRQYVAMLRANDGRLELSTLVHADEVVDPATIEELDGIGEVEVSDKELAMASQLVESMAGPFEPERFKDQYRDQVLELIERKAAGEVFEAPAEVAPAPKVVDLMAALEASVKAAKDARGRHPTARDGDGADTAERGESADAEAEAKPRRTRARKSA